MYQKEIKSETTRNPHKIVRFLRDAISGKHLLKTWRKWVPWMLILVCVSLLIVRNEYSIDRKEQRNERLQKQHDSIVVELRNVNEIIYTDDEMKLRQKAQENGFVDIENNDYYIINAQKKEDKDE